MPKKYHQHQYSLSYVQYNVWIGTDHAKNNYRTWFHFSVQGLSKGTVVGFKIKNMQNQVHILLVQSRLLNQGLVPVFREDGSDDWKRIRERINTAAIVMFSLSKEFNEGWI